MDSVVTRGRAIGRGATGRAATTPGDGRVTAAGAIGGGATCGGASGGGAIGGATCEGARSVGGAIGGGAVIARGVSSAAVAVLVWGATWTAVSRVAVGRTTSQMP